jgi:ion channel-forming bestrophin family protein
MHLGRKYKFAQFVGWTRREALLLIGWSLAVTAFLEFSRWHFLTIPAPVLTIVGSALAIILGFKNAQCYARFNEALALAGQVSTNSLIFANKLRATIGNSEAVRSGTELKELFHRHLAWLTALRFFLRERKSWENTAEKGNARFLARLLTPESQSALEDELKSYLPENEVQTAMIYGGDRLALLLQWQYETLTRLYKRKIFSEYIMIVLTGTLDELAKVQGALKRIKSYPYARNYYSIAVFLVAIFVVLLPFGLFPYARDLGEPAAIGHWTVWLNIPFSAVLGWVFVSLEKVGENSSNPFEGGANDVPISSIARRIEIEMLNMLGGAGDLKPVEPKHDVLF